MKTKTCFASLSLLLVGLFGCTNTSRQMMKENDGSVQLVETQGNTLAICKFQTSQDTLNIPLSELVEDCKIIRFENIEQALFKAWFITVTDNYIGVRQSEAAYKLYDSRGKYLCDIGAVGNGPGEYNISIYDEIIDEKGKRIFFSPFTGDKIMIYGLDGKWIKDIKLPRKINKPKISLNPDGTLSVVHMSFSEEEPLAFQVDLDGNIQKQLLTGPNRKVRNFDGEIFAYQNSGKLDFFHTSIDTLYRYDAAENQLLPLFTMDFPNPSKKPIHIYTDLPGHTIVNYYYWQNGHIEPGGTILVDKQKQASTHFKLQNDFFGNLPISAPGTHFNKGRFILSIEPEELREQIEGHLASSKCPDKDRQKLQELAASLNKNDNNILFTGKLKVR